MVGSPILGVSLQNTLLSINRFGGFFIAPLIGLMSDTGLSDKDIFKAALLSYIIASLVLSLIYFQWDSFSKTLELYIFKMDSLGYHRNINIIKVKSKRKKYLIKIKISFFIASAITTALATSSIFVMNIFAFSLPEFKATILQCGTLISGFGNLILNFYTYPYLSILENKKNAGNAYESIFLGKIFGLMVACPILTSCIYFYA
jgi:hypothetical protein